MMKWYLAIAVMVASIARGAAIDVVADGKSADAATVEVSGVEAGRFDVGKWATQPPRMVADVRSPMIEPAAGKYRNIYAPSVVETPGGWRVFYGAWDGQVDPHDRIYSLETTDFLTFSKRQKLIEHGAFDHVCNVSAIRNEDGSFEMMCTAFPDARGTNKPIYFSSRDGEKWDGVEPPFSATAAQLVTIDGYPDFAKADINGMNALLRDGGKYRLYFGDFAKFGHVYEAVGDDPRHLRLASECLGEALAVNDVKKIGATYLMALHMNRGALYYTLSDDPGKFPPAKILCEHLGKEDRFMVADGWVVKGERVLGVLYGAGASGNLMENRIFARWVQKRVEFVAGERRWEALRGRGPDRAVMEIPAGVRGHFEMEDEYGEAMGVSEEMMVEPGKAYRVAVGRGSR